MTREEARARATANFKSGMNCAQAVAETFAGELGMSAETLSALALPFGGGMCRMREVCGTVSGMMLCLGAAAGAPAGADGKAQKDGVYAEGQSLAARFRELNGSIICRELLGLVPLGTSERLLQEGTVKIHPADSRPADSPVSEPRTAEYYKKRPCAELCGVAAEIFHDWLTGYGRA